MKLRLLVLSLVVACSGGAVPLAAPPVPSAPDRPVPLRELLRTWTRPISPLAGRPAPGPSPATRADILTALSGGRRLDARCETPLLVALYQNGPRLNPPTRFLLDQLTRVPSESLGGVKMSAGNEFRIHYTTDPWSADRVDPYDGDLNGVPDGIDRLGSEFTDVLASFVHTLNWAPAPAPAGPDRAQAAMDGGVDVYLVGTMGPAGGSPGFVMPRTSGRPSPEAPIEELPEPIENSDAAIYLDARLAAPSASSRTAVAHMVAHLVLMRESVRESPWWHEASATWLETKLQNDAAAIVGGFAGPTAPAIRGLSDDTLGMSLEAFLWPQYLMQSTGSDTTLLRRMWEEMAAVPGNNTFEAIDRVLGRVAGTSLSEEIRVFNIWNLFLGQADDGRHYPFASLLPTPQGDATYETFPARGDSLTGPVPPLGSSMLRLLGDGTQGGLRVRFFGGEAGEWDVSLIVYSASRPGDVRLVPVELDSSGHGFIPVPWKSLAAIDLVIQNLASPTVAPADYYFAVDYDPAVPYDLLGFTADDSSHGAALAWSTDNEERLAGWNIWRGKAPLGPFSRVNRYMVPGAGLNGQPMSYMYVDTSAEPGRKYYYYLEGVTLDGFTENSHTAGVRLGVSATSSRSAR